MTKMEKTATIIVCSVLAIILVVAFTPSGRGMWNIWNGFVHKADDATSYSTRKEVEDTCRSMISSYESDKLSYNQYKESENAEKQSWAEQSKMRANKTAASYNNYILKNSYVWDGNVPSDINTELPYLK